MIDEEIQKLQTTENVEVVLDTESLEDTKKDIANVIKSCFQWCTADRRRACGPYFCFILRTSKLCNATMECTVFQNSMHSWILCGPGRAGLAVAVLACPNVVPPYQSPRGQRRACAASPSAVHALLSGMYSIKSPGWHSSTAHIFSNASIGRCLTVPEQIALMVEGLTPVSSANCFWFISFMASWTLTRNFIIQSRPFRGPIVSRI